MSPLQIGLVGATGRMGRLVERMAQDRDDWEIVARIHHGVPLETAAGCDLLIDFTVLNRSREVVDFALERHLPVLVGTSGWSRALLEELRPKAEAGDQTVVVIPNFSVASALSTRLAEMAAPFLSSAEVVEAHHAGKVDSPSGTAVATAEAIAAARDRPFVPPHPEQRARGLEVEGVPVHSMRLTGIVARQEIVFGGVGELLTITHDTISDESYLAGIERAIVYARTHPGLTVGLGEVLGLG